MGTREPCFLCMKKFLLRIFMALFVTAAAAVNPLQLGTFTAKNGQQYIRDIVEFTDGNKYYREVYDNGMTKYRSLTTNKFTSPSGIPKGATVAKTFKTFNAAGVLTGAAVVIAGGVALADTLAAKDEKTDWIDVAHSTSEGAAIAAGGALAFNSIPVGGQIAYGIAIGVGAGLGAASTGVRMFSETDCDRDPVTGTYACCNVSKLTNIKAARAGIGDEMFCDFPNVRMCLQKSYRSGKEYSSDQGWRGLGMDDLWGGCYRKLCNGWDMPESGNWEIQPYGAWESDGHVCWKWECADGNMYREGGRCIELDDEETEDVDVQAPLQEVDPAVYTCPEDGDASLLQSWKEECALLPEVLSMIDALERYCMGENVSRVTYQQMMQGIEDNLSLCTRQKNALYNKVSQMKSALDSMRAGFDVNVWRNKEGNFNTARLASDTVAGVVLGTAGALITSKVIKKNQIENGMEDIQCTVGGQVVGGFGDSFRVGIQ